MTRPPPNSPLFPYPTLFLFFLDTATAAERVGVSQRTIQAWIDAGFIHAVPIGRKFRVYLESLLNHVRTRALSRAVRSEEHTSELQSQSNLVCRLLLVKKKKY